MGGALLNGKPDLDAGFGELPADDYLLEALPVEAGLYYRLHPEAAPFGPEHASSTPLVPEELLQNPDWIGHSRGFAEPKPGYSAFWNPHHLEAYIREMGWESEGRRVIAFRGEPVGQGWDGEPLVMPHSAKIEAEIGWEQFCDRLEVTADGYGRWHEHSWGDGPGGPIVDDGYRRLRSL